MVIAYSELHCALAWCLITSQLPSRVSVMPNKSKDLSLRSTAPCYATFKLKFFFFRGYLLLPKLFLGRAEWTRKLNFGVFH